MNKHKYIFNWNHISEKLTQSEVNELKLYYKTYHKKFWAYKRAMKYYKKWKLIGNLLSILFATGGLASSVATGGIALVAISTVSL